MSIAALFGGVGSTIFPNLVTASNRADLSLTVFNASASQNSLTVMLIVALIGMPMVLAYTFYIYRTFAGTVGPESAHDGY